MRVPGLPRWANAVGLLLLCCLCSCDLFGGGPDPGVTNGIPEPGVQEFPRWSPDGRAILYYDDGLVSYDPATKTASYEMGRIGIWLMAVEGLQRRKLITAGYADWSPDGKSIVYEAGAQIYTARLAGGSIDTSTIVQLTPGGRNFFPEWSPDGEWIVHDRSIADEFGPGGVWIVKRDGTQWHRIFGGAAPAWHPDGESVIAAIGVSPETFEKRFVRYFPFSTAPPETLIAVEKADNRSPKYSPDGSKMAFDSNVQVWVMDSNGANKEQLTFGVGSMPDWSPDGHSIVYIGPQGTIWTMDTDGTDQKQLTVRPESHPIH